MSNHYAAMPNEAKNADATMPNEAKNADDTPQGRLVYGQAPREDKHCLPANNGWEWRPQKRITLLKYFAIILHVGQHGMMKLR